MFFKTLKNTFTLYMVNLHRWNVFHWCKTVFFFLHISVQNLFSSTATYKYFRIQFRFHPEICICLNSAVWGGEADSAVWMTPGRQTPRGVNDTAESKCPRGFIMEDFAGLWLLLNEQLGKFLFWVNRFEEKKWGFTRSKIVSPKSES